MSMNKFMHPRNIYKSPPNFKEIALKYPEFKKYIKLDISGKTTFDFKDPEALRALSCTLLKKDFDLDVKIPTSKLIPTIPLRLNYILWIEDLLLLLQRSSDIQGIDIGTGASCVYPLMIAKKNYWSMLATESDNDSIDCASTNIKNNNLDSLISIVKVIGNTLLKDVVSTKQEYDFCMCNPPFFSSTQELHPFFKCRKQNRPHPKNAFVASINEVVSKGGEVEFIQKIINESKDLHTKIKIYTTMVGQKSHLPALKKSLREVKVHSFVETEFCQGNTTRWGLAWTFLDCDLRKVPNPVKLAIKIKPKHAPLFYELPGLEYSAENLEKTVEIMLSIFRDLNMTLEDVTRNKLHPRFFVTAYSNTWSNQRRKRRGNIRNNSESLKEYVLHQNNNMENCKSEILNSQNSPGKRSLDHLCQSTSKKLKLSTDSESTETTVVYFKFMFAINNGNKITLELNTIDETFNRDYLYQILQYIKNNFLKISQEKKM